MSRFEIGKIYVVKWRVNRVFFKVTERTSRTVTFAYIGTQNDPHDCGGDRIDVAGNNETQKIGVYSDTWDGTEYGYVRFQDDHPWMGLREAREVISARNESYLRFEEGAILNG